MKIKASITRLAMLPLGLPLLAVLSLSSDIAQAATETWTGVTTGLWGTNTNWSASITPDSTYDLTILGPSNVMAGALTINIAAAASANSINFTDTAAVTLNNTTSGANQTLTIGAGGLTVGTGAVTIGSATANQNVNIALGASQTWNIGAGGLTVSNVVSDGGSAFGLTKTGAGTLTLAGANTYTGTTTINAGTLTLSGAISSSSALSLGGGTLNYTKSGGTQTFNGTTVNSGFSTVTNGTAGQTVALGALTRNAGGILNVSSLTGATTTTTVNDGTGILGDWATEGTGTSLQYATGGGTIAAYTGATAGTAGTLANVTSSGTNYSFGAAATQTGAITANTLRYTGAAATWANGGFGVTLNGLMNAGTGLLTVSGAGTITIGANQELVIVGNTQGATISSVIANNGGGASSLVYGGPSAGTLTLTGLNTYSGGTTVNGGTLSVAVASTTSAGGANPGPAGTGSITLNGGTLNSAEPGGGVNMTIANNIVIGTGLNSIKDDSVKDFNLTTGTLSGSGNLTVGNSTTTSTLRLGMTNSMTGGTITFAAGGNNVNRITNASFGNANVAWVFSNVTANKQASLEFATGTIDFGSMTGNGNINGALAGAKTISAGALNLNDTFSGIISNSLGTVGLTKVGTGTMTLSGANTYTGGTTIKNGSILIGVSNATTVSGALGTSASAVTLGDSTGTNSASLLTNGAFTFSNAITVALGSTGNTLSIGGNTANTSTFSGGITLNKDLTVSQVASGTLNLTGNITSGSSGTQTITFNNAGSVSQSTGVIGGGTGTIGVSNTGSGTTTLSGVNTYGGATSITGGTLLVNAGSINNTSGITINGSGAKYVHTSTTASDRTITLTQGTVDGTGALGTVNVANLAGNTITNGNGGAGTLTIGTLAFSGSGNINVNEANTTKGLALTTFTTANDGGGKITINATNSSAWSNGTTYDLITFTSITGGLTDFTKGTVTGISGRQNAALGLSGNAVTLAVTGDNPVWTGVGSQTWTTAATNDNTGPNAWALKTGHTATNFWVNDAVEFNDTYDLGSGSTAVTSSTVTITGGVAPVSTTFNNSSVNYTINSSDSTGITAGTLIKNGTASLTISNANTYSGGTTLNAGTLNINNASAIGTGALTIAAGTLDNTSGAAITLSTNNAQNWNGNFAFTGTKDLNMGTGAVTLGASPTVTVNNGTLTVGGAIGGSFGLTKSGSGTLLLAGASTYNGGTTINSGWVKVGNATALGDNSGAVSVSSGAALDLNGTTMTGQNALTLNGTGISNGGALTNSSATAGTYAGLVSLGSDSSIVASNGNIILSKVGTITGSGFNLTLDGTATGSSIASIIGTGSGSVTKNGSGTWTLSVANTYSGGATLNAGTLIYSNNNAFGTGTLTLNGGTLKNGASAIGNNIAVSGATTFDLAGGNNNWSGNLSGTAALTLNNSSFAATLNLSGSNSAYSGTITFNNNNAVDFTSANAGSANAAWVFNDANAGRVRIDVGNNTLNFGSLAGSGQFVNNTASSTSVLSVGALNTDTTFGGTINDNGTGVLALTKAGSGKLTLAGNNGYSGATTISSGTLAITGTGALGGTSLVNIADGATLGYTGASDTFAKNVTITSGTGTISNTGSGTLGLSGTLTKAGTTLALGGNFNVSGMITGSTGSFNSDVNITSGTTIYSTAQGYFGATNVFSGATLKNGIANALPASTVLNLGGTYNLGGYDQQIAGLSALSGSPTITNSGTSTLTVNNDSAATSGTTDYTYSGVIADGTGKTSLTKTGNMTLTLTGSNSYSGGTTLTSGTLVAGNNYALGSGLMTLNGGNLASDNSIRNLLNPIVVNASSINGGVSGDNDLTFMGGAYGSGTLVVKGGSGKVIIAGAEDSFAPTGIQVNAGGTLLLGGANKIGNSGTATAINLNGGTFNTGGFDEAVGALTLSANSTIDFTAGTGTMRFDSLTADTTGQTLALLNWTSGSSHLVFTSSVSGYTNFLGGVSFNGTPGAQQINFGGGGYELVPIPEPATIVGALAILGLIVLRERKRFDAIRNLSKHLATDKTVSSNSNS